MKKLLFILIPLLFLVGCSSIAVSTGFDKTVNIEGNNIPVVNKDFADRESLNSVFGDKIIASRIPNLAGQFQYPLESTSINTPEIVTTGFVAQQNSLLQLHTGSSSNGSSAVQTLTYLRYLPGHEVQGLFTPIFSSNTNIRQRGGIFDSNDGFFLEWDGVNLDTCRRRAATDFCETINLTNVFGEGIDLDPTKGNIYSISYGYLGFAPITFAVMTPQGGWKILNKFEYPNSDTLTHITQSFLPLRAESTNIGNTNDTILKIGSVWGGIIDGNILAGSRNDPSARFFTQESPVVASTSGVLFSFRSKSTYGGIDNRINSLLKLVSCSTEGNKPVRFKLLKNPSFVSATWQNVSVDSVLEYSTNLVLSPGAEDGESFLYWDMGKSDSFFENVETQNLLLPPNGVAVFYFESLNANEVQCAIRWAELF